MFWSKSNRLNTGFLEIREKLHRDVLADNPPRKTAMRYRNTYRRMFVDFRDEYFPEVKTPNQLSLMFFREYKSYYVNTLKRPFGWRAELIIVKAIMRRLYALGYCQKDIIEKLKEEKRPRANKKDYPDIAKGKMAELFSFIKRDRPDYYACLYFMFRTGRRRQETTLIRKSDVLFKESRPVAVNIRAETTKCREKAPLRWIDGDLEELIRLALDNNNTVWLFPNRLGRRCSPDRVCDYLRKASREVIGIEITPHYLRHRFFTECAKANASLTDVKAISGIKDSKVLLDYYSHSTVDGQARVFAVTSL